MCWRLFGNLTSKIPSISYYLNDPLQFKPFIQSYSTACGKVYLGMAFSVACWWNARRFNTGFVNPAVVCSDEPPETVPFVAVLCAGVVTKLACSFSYYHNSSSGCACRTT